MQNKRDPSAGLYIMETDIGKISVKYGENLMDIDDNTYHTLIIENNGTKQCWMQENLKVKHYRNGIEIPDIILNDEWAKNDRTGKSCDYSISAKDYGKLYNWYAIISKNNICPEGWRIPAMEDWLILISIVGSMGGKLKENGLMHWSPPNEGGSNETLFTALPGGCRSGEGDFQKIHDYGLWWSQTPHSKQSAFYFLLYAGLPCANIFYGGMNYGMSIRCIKDIV